jgi:hypothetical protein
MTNTTTITVNNPIRKPSGLFKVSLVTYLREKYRLRSILHPGKDQMSVLFLV